MRAETVKEIQSQARKLLPIVEQLNVVWNRPLIEMCGVLIQNLQFRGGSVSQDEEKIMNIHKTIKLLNENSFKDPFIKWLWVEVDCIITGCIAMEEYEEFNSVNLND